MGLILLPFPSTKNLAWQSKEAKATFLFLQYLRLKGPWLVICEL